MQLCIYLCMYLPQAISLLPPLGIEWDLFRRIHPSEEVALEPMVGTGSVAAPLSPATPLQSRQVHGRKTGPCLAQIADNQLPFRSELGLACRNLAHQTVRPSPLYF